MADDLKDKFNFKAPTWPFISLLLTIFVILSIYSFSKVQLKIGNIEIEKTDIKNYFLEDTIKPTGIAVATFEERKEEPTKLDTTKQRILIIGDSMIEGLMLRLRDYTEYNNHELQPVIWYSSQTEWFGKYDTLGYYIRKVKPTYIMLVIGSNELFVRDIALKREKYVRRILSTVDTIKYIWIGPPNWKDDTGINDMILRNTGSKRYFPSKNLTYQRGKDGAHPTYASAAIWMDSIANWIMTKSKYPILLKKPVEKRKGTPHAILLQPLK